MGIVLLLGSSALVTPACADSPELSAAVPGATLSHDNVDFGGLWVGETASRTVSLRSTGTAVLEVDGAHVDGDAAFSIDPVRATSLEPGEQLDVEVRFAPASPGTSSGRLVFSGPGDAARDAALESARVSLTGSAHAADDCDDDNPCTSEQFDLATGGCVTAPRSGTCDDGSACTRDDLCFEGACVGEAVSCADADACTADVCDAAVGCRFIREAGLCDDQNPCTSDACDPALGCRNEPVPDGAPCGPREGCSVLHRCAAGACVASPVPDGAPCDDGDYCTLADRCESGACSGEHTTQTPAVIGELASFGAAEGFASVLPGERILFADLHGSHAVPIVNLRARPAATLTLVAREGDRLRALDVLTLDVAPDAPSNYHLVMEALGSGAVVLYEWPTGQLRFFEIAGGASLVPAGSIDFGWDAAGGRVAVLEPFVYVARTQGTVVDIVSAADLAAPVPVGQLDVGAGIFHLAVDAAGQRLVVATVTGLSRYDLSLPEAPQPLDSTLSGELLVWAGASGDHVAAAGAHKEDLHLFDAADLAPRGQLSVGCPGTVDANDWALSGDTLVAVHRICGGANGQYVAELYDLAGTGVPQRLGSRPFTTGYGWMDWHLSAAGATATLRRMNGQSVHVLDVDPVRAAAGDAFDEVTGPGHGSVHTLVRLPGGLFTVGPDAAHRLDVASPDVWAAGGMFAGGASLVSLSNSGNGIPSYPTSPGYESLYYGALSYGELGTWVSAADPDDSAVVGSLGTGGSMVRVSDGRHLYGVGYPDYWWSGDPVTLHVFDLVALGGPGFDQVPEPVSTLVLGNADCAARPENIAVGLSADHATLVVATNPPEGCGGPGTALYVVDVAQSEAPALLAALEGEALEPVSGVATDGAAVAVIAGAETSIGATRAFSGTELRIYDVVAAPAPGTLIHRLTAAVPTSNHVLAFDGTTAFVSTETGVSIVDVTAPPGAVVAELPTPRSPTSAVVDAGRLYVGSATAVTVIAPPCP